MFDTILIANRGEIALRVIRTAKRLGIRTVAVYSDADAHAAHVRAADTAVRLGPAQASESYLDIDKVIAAAKATGAEAIHPGYGFLSENADFSAACDAAGIVFLGPGPEAIRTMGDKITAKQAVSAHGVPLVPGTKDAGSSDEALIAAAEDIGFPVLIKPSAGGGGKGMHAVFEPSELPAALKTARREAANSFGDDTLFLERLVATPRHIEVQVMADAHGNVIHLGERECSLQRRHQKVIEEAPSALLDDETRARIGEAAIETARSVGYRGAGTPVADRAGGLDRGLTDPGPRLVVEERGGGLLDDLLVAALERAFAFAEVDDIPVRIGHDLDLDVARGGDEAFEEERVVAEGVRGLTAGGLECCREFGGLEDGVHALAAASGGGLDEDGEADVLGCGDEGLVGGPGVLRARHEGDAVGRDRLLRGDLVAHRPDRLGAGAEEDDAGGIAGGGEVGVLGEEPVAGVDGLGSRRLRCGDDLVDVEVGLARLGGAEAHGGVGGSHVGGVGVGVGVDGDGADAQALGGADDAEGDLAAVGDEDGVEHSQLTF